MGFYVYVARSDYDSTLFIGHVNFQDGRGSPVVSRMLFTSHDYTEARNVCQSVADYLNNEAVFNLYK